MSVSIKYRLHENITNLISDAQVFFNYTTSRTVFNLHSVEREKRQKINFQSLDTPPEFSSENSRWKSRKKSVNKN